LPFDRAAYFEKIKETDRLKLLKLKLVQQAVTNDSSHLKLHIQLILILKLLPIMIIEWRWLSPIGIKIAYHNENAEVVSKSYPDFGRI
jgi:uncharacterized membrane protein (DUF106 family)